MADLTDPKDYSHATRGRRELDDYKAAYNSEKQSEAINANTDEVEGLIGTTNTKLTSIGTDVATIKNDLALTKADVNSIMGYVDGVEGALATSNANTTAIANDVATTKSDVAAIKGNTDQVEAKLDTLATKLDSVLGRLDNIIELMSTPEV